MNIQVDHKTSQEEAQKKIDSFLDNLIKREFPAGVKIKDPQKKWNGSKMDFSFKAKKGIFLSVTLNGSIDVREKTISLDCDVPGIVTTFVDEDKIKDVIKNEAEKLFA